MTNGKNEVLQVADLTKTYQCGQRSLTVLEGVGFALATGDTCSIVGPSGSGKTTLLGLCAGLDAPSSGNVTLCGHPFGSLSEDERAAVRNEHVGFVFQSFRLIPTLTAIENVMVPAELRGRNNARPEAAALLADVGLGDRMDHFPAQLSGGEQQRVALARAFINRPDILFADEPTGNLDSETGEHVVDLLFRLNREAGTTLVLVTHDLDLAAMTDRIIRLHGGKVVSDTRTATALAAMEG
ncbi:MAG: ABC transporter ATP-binding protein [Bacteroidetes bacterium]|nr:ABC transporter ATP-binding protein [Bacteroidota bacterium]MDA0873548.1 ABC transporter ATP-binding protein [Bacteroidota bacterium]